MGLGFIGAPLGAAFGTSPRPLVSGRRAPQPRWRAAVETPAPATEAPTEWAGAQTLSKGASVWPTVIGMERIMEILPHRFPFLLVDRVVAFEAGKRAVAIKNVSMNEPHFTGHFPDRPIMPGVLQVEALAQVAGIVMLQEPISDGKGDFYFGGVDKVRWRRPVVPGDTLVMEMELKSFKPRFGIAKMEGKYVSL